MRKTNCSTAIFENEFYYDKHNNLISSAIFRNGCYDLVNYCVKDYIFTNK